ncbi:hypothetical protein BVRB_013800 isoform A [Beta vulgaris subsp. vulgaris]|uniref:Uncharacterized protein n=1 Tax=Beta vulgaris subsp. vulgaris TaxID=3555 RepID=A0A0J8DVR4_BETVV|nr:hypothetical protein BVRB_013800 isoform A [Beta vulgaris subsp. vulgaris]
MEEKTAKSEIHLPILPDDLIVEQILPRLPKIQCLNAPFISLKTTNISGDL